MFYRFEMRVEGVGAEVRLFQTKTDALSFIVPFLQIQRLVSYDMVNP